MTRANSPLGARPAYALALASGVLYFLAFPGIELWPLAFVAIAPLVVALRGQAPRRAFGLGWIAGFAMTMCGFYWLLDMLKTFSGFGTPLCLLFMAILCGYQAGRIGLLGWLCARAERRGWHFELCFVLAFAASELVYPLLFPWYFGAAVHQVPALTQLAELGGPIAVALMLLAPNLAFAELARARLEARPWRRRLLAVCAATLAVGTAYGVARIPSVDAAAAAAPHARVGIVQANMSLLGKRHDPLKGLNTHLQLTRQLQREGNLDLVIWSETSVMSALKEDIAAEQLSARFTRFLHVPALFGAVIVREVNDEREYVLFNSAVLTDQSGKLLGRYDKHVLLAFGEYLPFGESYPILYRWSPNTGKFTPGRTLDPLKLDGHAIATCICYDDIFPGFMNSVVTSGATDLLANLTNDAWFGDTTEPWIHLALAQFRSIEHRRYFVRSTNSGVSAFIDPVGRVVAHSEPFQEQALAHEIAWMRSRTPYELWGDIPWWLATAAIALAGFVPRRRKQGPIPPSTEASGDASSLARFRSASRERLMKSARS